MRVNYFIDKVMTFCGANLQGMSSKYILVSHDDGLSSVDEIRKFVNVTLGAEKVVGEIMANLKKIC